MSPYLGRIVSRTPRLKQLHSRFSRPIQQLTRVQPWPKFFPPSELPIRNVHGLVNITQRRNLSLATSTPENTSEPAEPVIPVCCPGCGAYAQTIDPQEPGYYSRTKTVLKHAPDAEQETREAEEVEDLQTKGEEAALTIQKAIKELEMNPRAPKPHHGALLETATATAEEYIEKFKRPSKLCKRCHELLHHNTAVPVVAPSVHSIGPYLEESPYKYNRIYHVIDAADFPMSLVDNIHEVLSIQEQRSRNRRATVEKYRGGKKLPTISYIITRSDLLAPTKEQVDSKMEYIRSTIREILDKWGQGFRLGNVHMISAHRGWWTKKVKEEISDHGGGIWVIGKANVGKSSFIEACFPKDSKNLEKIAELVERRQAESDRFRTYDTNGLASDGLLPPAPREDLYPVLPVISSLPGTTVSPIRIPFGRGRGEMIDLPGFERSELTEYTRDEYKRDLTMTKRIKPERFAIKPGQSLLLGGGLVRITSKNLDDVLMAACFVPIESHVTNTVKASEMQAEQRPYPKEPIMKEGTGSTIASAGVFDLKWDVTKSHLPTHIAKAIEDHGIKPPSLPYKVMSTDILIEGCGWIELTVQIRAKSVDGDSGRLLPQVEIFTPNGKHIGARKPIECWNFIAEKRATDNRKKGARGRQSISLKKRAQHASKV
ncbi:hypothetical protein BDV25DRAFT_154358 [Aspergillus avenaceus]|uniref:G domain-containing protein n=1 Tax=Aspergillus avenaceus TaxID=36643 RepID=A0A5N6TVL1_ASPAV|nr:hypothetical protein BDV25DRAFT_154358 [Aspergillus avenaceus]